MQLLAQSGRLLSLTVEISSRPIDGPPIQRPFLTFVMITSMLAEFLRSRERPCGQASATSGVLTGDNSGWKCFG